MFSVRSGIELGAELPARVVILFDFPNGRPTVCQTVFQSACGILSPRQQRGRSASLPPPDGPGVVPPSLANTPEVGVSPAEYWKDAQLHADGSTNTSKNNFPRVSNRTQGWRGRLWAPAPLLAEPAPARPARGGRQSTCHSHTDFTGGGGRWEPHTGRATLGGLFSSSLRWGIIRLI